MDIDDLVKAVQTLNADDAFRARLTIDNWRTIAPYLARYEIRAGDLLIKQGDADRSMYFLAQGSMQIFMTGGPPGSSKVAILACLTTLATASIHSRSVCAPKP